MEFSECHPALPGRGTSSKVAIPPYQILETASEFERSGNRGARGRGYVEARTSGGIHEERGALEGRDSVPLGLVHHPDGSMRSCPRGVEFHVAAELGEVGDLGSPEIDEESLYSFVSYDDRC